MSELRNVRPDDRHLHLRDRAHLATTVPHSARCFGRAIVMPNLLPPVTAVASALAYRQRIMRAVGGALDFDPLMTLYLTDQTAPEEIVRAKNSAHVVAAKFYPAGASAYH